MSYVFKKRITRCLDKDGKQVPAGTPGAKRVKQKSTKWYGRVPGNPRAVPLSTNKNAAQLLLNELVKKAELVKAGVADPFEAHHKRPLTEHAEDYRRHLLAKGDCAEHVAKTGARLAAVLRGCQFAFIADLSASAVAEFLHELRRAPPRPDLPAGKVWFTKGELLAALGNSRPAALARVLRREALPAEGSGKARRYPRATVSALQNRFCRGLAVNTSNGYLRAIRGFTKWLVRDRRTGSDPLVSLAALNAKVDVRHERRAATETEMRHLLAAALSSPDQAEGLSGPERAWLYAVAMATGFRAAELASLTPASFRLEDPLPVAVVRAGYTKNRQQAEQPLPPDLAEALRGFLNARPAGVPVWSGGWPKKAAAMLRGDLARAAIPYRDAEGRVLDFHALRHSYITLLSQSGVHPRMAQELARHSDIRLTMNVYTHTSGYDLAGAVAGLPVLLPGGLEAQPARLRATGTGGGDGLERAKSDAQAVPFSCSPVAQSCATEREAVRENEKGPGRD